MKPADKIQTQEVLEFGFARMKKNCPDRV